MSKVKFPVQLFRLDSGEDIPTRPSHKSSADNSVAGVCWAMYIALRRLGFYFYGEDAQSLLRINPSASSCSATADDLHRAKVTIMASFMVLRSDLEGNQEFSGMLAGFQ